MRWLAEYQIKSNLRLEPGQSQEVVQEFDGVQILLRNAPDYDHRGEGLIGRLIFKAETVEDAERTADDNLTGFLNLLCFSTNVGARIAHRTYLAEWPEIPGPIRVFQYVYTEVDDPFEIVNQDILGAVGNLSSRDIDPAVGQAFSYYNSALRSTVIVDQFQLFWFVVETLSTRVSIEPAPDLCSCGGAIVCKSCEKAAIRSTNRKRIDEVFKSTGLDPRLIRGLSKVRNMLLHGANAEEIDVYMQTKMKSPDFTMAKAVTVLSDRAWIALAKSMGGYLDDHWPILPHADTVKAYRLIGRAEMGLDAPADGKPFDMNNLPIGTLQILREPALASEETVAN